MENTENTSTNSSPLDFGSFSENPFTKLMAGGESFGNDIKEFFTPATFGFILFFFVGLYYYFSKQMQNTVQSTKQSIHQAIQTKIIQWSPSDQESPPGIPVRFLQYLDTLFSDSNEEEEDEEEDEDEDEESEDEEGDEEDATPRQGSSGNPSFPVGI